MENKGFNNKDRLVQLFLDYGKSKAEFDRSYLGKLQRALDRIYKFVRVEPILSGAEPVFQAMVRLTGRCNQRCPFCQAYSPHPEEGPSLDELKRAADRLASTLPISKITLSGGEPTLRKDLRELVDHLAGLEGIGLTEVQTNAALISARPEQFDFEPSDRLRFLVAMHGLDDAVYDACTGTRGQLPRALEGVQHLLNAGHVLEFNYVINDLNLRHLSDYIAAYPARFSGSNLPAVHFSMMGVAEHVDFTPLHVRYTDMLARLEPALELAGKLGVPARVALSAGHAVIPLCILGSRPLLTAEYPRMYEHERTDPDADPARWWDKGPGCAECRVGRFCLGLPRSYAERFGFDELDPIG